MLAFTNIPDRYYYNYFDGDTIIQARTFKKMYMADTPFEKQQRTYVGAWFEEYKKVYFSGPNTNDLFLCYNFGLSVGQEFQMETRYHEYTLKGIVADIHYDGDDFSKMTALEIAPLRELQNGQEAYDYEYPLFWREGVGGYRVDDNAPEGAMVGGNILTAACYIGDEVLFYDPELTITDSEVKKNWLDFTHTVKTRPKGPRRVETESDEETVTGEYSIKELFVNFKTLTGPYTITVLDAAGQPIYNKVVQTSNVVALNTDISTYAKGSYTITVENEDEAYSAEFLISDEDGLTPQPPLLQRGGEAGAVYNLNGQRLTKPQRGVNIVNGRKVVVR